MNGIATSIWSHISQHLNFYRIHLLLFTTVPLVFSAIFFASNGRFHIKYTDALFVCVSAVTGTGLSTIDLSSLTAWQQAIIVFLELIGNQVFVSWAVVFVRRLYYRKHLRRRFGSREIHQAMMRNNTQTGTEQPPSLGILRRNMLHQRHKRNEVYHIGREIRRQTSPIKLRPEMVRRTDIAPQRINPTGTVDVAAETIEARTTSARQHIQDSEDRMPRTQTRVTISEQPPPVRSKEEGFGGFPGPQDLTSKILMKMFPGLHRKIRRTLTVPQTHTFVPQDEAHDEQFAASSTLVPYFSFAATVGRNSVFLNLTEEQMDELGGVEYRALNTLLWVTPLYYFGLMTIGLIIIAPYMYLPRWKANFVPPQQHRKISPMWFSLFQVVGAWSNTGMSLVDQNLEPFQNAYPMLVVLIFLVMAGNTAFPILFRFTCWLLRKAFTLRTSTGESLLFLLHHPRRCFINLFPARQTWLLLIIVAALTLVTMIGDLVLNIGNPVMDAIPVGRRILLALVQSAATRSAGFQPFPLSDQYPAALVLYVITMYIAIYPIAMSVRSTNVYEEQSLGIYPSETLNTYPDSNDSEHRIAIWGKYLMRHARRQLSFDMWWLALSLLLIAIVERPGLTDPAKSSWLNLFALIFELVSAYGTVGLSLGVPNENYSLSGALHPLSKLIVCVVMLRGRHRGLPVALDRAVMMPQEFRKHVTIHNSTSSVPQPPSPKPSEVEAEAEETTSSSEGVGSDNVVQSSAAMQSLEMDEKTRNGEFEGVSRASSMHLTPLYTWQESDVNVV